MTPEVSRTLAMLRNLITTTGGSASAAIGICEKIAEGDALTTKEKEIVNEAIEQGKQYGIEIDKEVLGYE